MAVRRRYVLWGVVLCAAILLLIGCDPPRDEGFVLSGCQDTSCGPHGHCVKDDHGARCECDPGFEVGTNLVYCVDTDECADGGSLCGGLGTCNNTVGAYECCPFGIDRDEGVCKPDPNGGTGGTSGTGGTGGTAGTAGTGATSSTPLSLSFTPSNVDVTRFAGSRFRDFRVGTGNAVGDGLDRLHALQINTDTLELSFATPTVSGDTRQTIRADGTNFVFEAVSQRTGGDQVALLVVNSLRVEGGEEVLAVGSRPLVIVAATNIDVTGGFLVSAGARQGPQGNIGTSSVAGVGPGAGQVGFSQSSGRGGGSYCSPGGRGGDGGGAAGTIYGSGSIVPLQGGSSGARGGLTTCSGAGGGALQLVAGASISITGYVSAPGAGGCRDATYGGSGGGSGGAILVEAPQVAVSGALAVNGGGGGAVADGVQGSNSNQRPSSSCLGAGAAADLPAQDGVNDNAACVSSGGGGGGAGFVRINTATGMMSLGSPTALSPTQTTGCSTVSTLSP